MKPPKPVTITPELAGKCDGPDQLRAFDALVGKLMTIPPSRAADIRRSAAVHTTRRGRPKKTSPAPGASLQA